MWLSPKRNIALIGMPGAGKSTIGVLLAKAVGRLFIDTDIYIQAIENRSLKDIIDEIGLKKFCRMERDHIFCIDAKNAVIATGGSVVYSPRLMHHFRRTSIVIHLEIDFRTFKSRVGNLEARGVVIRKGQTIEELYAERMPLYQKYANMTFDCTGKNHQQVLADLLEAFE